MACNEAIAKCHARVDLGKQWEGASIAQGWCSNKPLTLFTKSKRGIRSSANHAWGPVLRHAFRTGRKDYWLPLARLRAQLWQPPGKICGCCCLHE